MKKISRIDPFLPVIQEQKKVVVYARVSKDTKRLINSVSAQVSYYKNIIQNNPEWEYAGVYVDCGITGTLTSKRSEFQRMIANCKEGKIDIILTKSISRFARNTVDLLNTVRYLKSLGIEVWFEKEKIHSLSEEGELMLSLLASFAQEESRSISENIKWGIRKRFQSGEIGEVNKHILGYQYNETQKKYVIIPKEAETVRWIFNMYLQKLSLREIAKRLNNAGVDTIKGCRFTEVSLNSLIHNEIYAGNLKRQKSFVEDPIIKNKILNRGQLPQYYIQNCHKAILNKETWLEVQKEIERRAGMKNPTYCFTGKIKCGICGSCFTRKKDITKKKAYVYWICRSKKEVGMSCISKNFSENKLKQICADVLGTTIFDEKVFQDKIRTITVQKNSNLEFQFTDNRTKIWNFETEKGKI